MKSKSRRKGSTSAANGGGGGIVIEATNRKARRKELRTLAKKKKHESLSTTKHNKESTNSSSNAVKRELDTTDSANIRNNKRVKISNNVQVKTIPSVKNHIPIGLKKKKKSKYNSTSNSDDSDSNDDEYYTNNNNNKQSKYYNNLDDETAIAIHADDVEISYLESNLGIKKKSSSKGKKSNKELLNREYSKNEGFGNDFGDFLMDLDNLVDRCVGNDDDEEDEDDSSDNSDSSDDSASSKASEDGNNTKLSTMEMTYDSDESSSSIVPHLQEDPYANLDEEMALALRNDDAEIAALEEKLGLAESAKSKKKLKKEFARDMGDDFGDFLDGLDKLGDMVHSSQDDQQYGRTMDSDDSSNGSGAQNASEEEDESDSSEDSEEEELEDTADHDVSLTYRPTTGEDIYGNKIDSSQNDDKKPTKYIPPHLRKKQETTETAEDDDNDDESSNKVPTITADPETIQHIQRQLNNILNRLSIQTLESVSKSLSKLYATYPFHDVNDCLWKNIQSACCPPYMIMSGLIPLYIGSMAGVHWLGGDSIQLGGNLVELSITKLFNSLKKGRSKSNSEGGDAQENELINKEASNLLLIVCYLYNYGVIHCSLIYDLIRDFIASFTEIDVESLLLVLSHCGQQLRSDDPSALKEIVLLVKDRAQKSVSDDKAADSSAADTSRIQYMVDTITELKNNKPRKQDVVLREKTNAIKKCVGRVKTSASQLLAGKKSGSCLRVTLQDILQAETKGRWWLVGASWVGNQHHEQLFDNKSTLEEDEYKETGGSRSLSKKSSNKEEDSLLALASSQRMNTDARRSIFCIIMGSTDCNDAFEKLIRSGNLKPKAERDVIRVIVHCCGEEKAYNPYYAFLATRCCEYQGKSRFTLMLTFYDVFKMIDTYSVRKIANLAKLLAHLMGSSDRCLTIGVLKRIDFSPSDMSEMIILFLSIFMSTLFESCDVDDVVKIFSHGINTEQTNSTAVKKRRKKKMSAFDSDDESEDGNNKVQTTKKEDLCELRESLSVFLLQYLKQSPLNVEGSDFQACLLSAISTCEQS